MIAYIDTSALLRIILREPGALDDLRMYDGLVSSELIAVESARTIDRLRMQGALTMEEAANRIGAVNDWLEAIDLVLLRPPVLSRAGEPMPMPIGTLDAIHLSALEFVRAQKQNVQLASYDERLLSVARLLGISIWNADEPRQSQ